ncbi:MAG TPA: alpha/beta hydrolase [Acidimicrobiaceae bacterium]|nr:alpha/beta hydrolase [Acidimicrobiaceae bacterium]
MRRIIPLFAATVLLAGACAGDDPVDSVEPTTATETGEIPWEQFGPDSRVQTGNLEVPVNYDDPSAGTFDLFIARHRAPAATRIGSLLVNPGGPGFGGADYAIYAEQIFSEKLTERFDIVGWDPRGTGLTEPAIDCIDDYDRFYAGTDITPDDDAERQQLIDLAEEFADGCVSNNADILPYITTNNTARDMDSIRQALGEATISYFGFSYGSELGATWATLFPDTVRAAVLDGAADPTAGFTESGVQQAAGFEGTLTTFLAQCSADPDCAFHNDGDAEGAFDDLMLALDEQPVPSREGRPDVTRGVAINAVALAMYSESYWDLLEQALSNAQFGEGERLLDLHDQYFQRRDDGTWDNSLEAFQAIVCMDDAERLSVADDDATAEQYRSVAPRFAPGTTGSYFCTFFPPSIDPRVEVTGVGAGPILVMGTTGDPATPLSSTEAMADALEDGRLVIVTADQHTGYGVNQCAYDVIDDYLIDPVNNAPADGFRCE